MTALALERSPETELPTAWQELAGGLGLRGEIAMLWAYFDETGTHGDDGRLVRMNIGGMVADRSAWDELEGDWSRALAKIGKPSLHMRTLMKDREQMIDAFLPIVANHTPVC